ncbi:hypothetical protein E1A91_A10G103500v1 [Gossypium mustelinum]|uniref:Subtilisin-like protease SBT3.16 n=2 Tax=Gossypium TaxID=3633 RepID=A0ABM2YYK4_GOSHI|nr:subtilisin-like protease SBT3.16 [Gossypium hirsutum]TYJ14227.1 hypothetical protein E1A91_A10G103500v1 [Gossypium mustelinum]
MLSNLLGSKEAEKSSMLNSYKHGFSGFAARLTESQEKEIEGLYFLVRICFGLSVEEALWSLFHGRSSWFMFQRKL